MGMAASGTFLPFQSDSSNGNSCQERTFSGCLTGIAAALDPAGERRRRPQPREIAQGAGARRSWRSGDALIHIAKEAGACFERFDDRWLEAIDRIAAPLPHPIVDRVVQLNLVDG